MGEQELYLRKIEEADIGLMNVWLNKPYILRWYTEPEAWLYEIKQRNGSYGFIHHSIVMDSIRPIGFCQYYDCYEAKEDWYSVEAPGETYSVDYLIGEESYLGKGCGKEIIRLLIESLLANTRAKEIIVKPEEDNLPSCGALVSCGFDYDKTAGLYRLGLQSTV